MRELTSKQEKFIDELIANGGNKTQAYRAVYNCSNMKNSTVTKKACELLKKGNVRGIYDEKRKKLREASSTKAEISSQEVIEELANIAKSDIVDFYVFEEQDKRGNFIPIVKDLTNLNTRAIKEIRTDKSGKICAIMMYDKLQALARLEEILGVKEELFEKKGGVTIKFAGGFEGMDG